jgi:hypothetical protein
MTKDHRKRILDHQERVAAEQRLQPSDPQMKIPLIGEVRLPDPTRPKRARRRVTKPNQPQLRDV